MGCSKRGVMTAGARVASKCFTASSRLCPFRPFATSAAICSHRASSRGPHSRCLRFAGTVVVVAAVPVVDVDGGALARISSPPVTALTALSLFDGRNEYSGKRRLCSAKARFAFACQIWRSSKLRLCHTMPTILDSVPWLPSMLDDTCCDLMKDERKRMNALGGRGMCSGATLPSSSASLGAVEAVLRRRFGAGW